MPLADGLVAKMRASVAVLLRTAVELTVAGANRLLQARVTSVSSELEPLRDFAVAEAEIVDAGAARDVQTGTLGDARALASE